VIIMIMMTTITSRRYIMVTLLRLYIRQIDIDIQYYAQT
jgi:hypothetical protein